MRAPVWERSRRERRVWAAGLLLSVGVHVAVLLVFRSGSLPVSPAAAAGPRAGSPKAAAGGGGLTAILFRPPRPIVVPPRPEAVVEPKPIELERLLELQLSFSPVTLPAVGEGRVPGSRSGPGLPGGEGAGDAGDAAEGLLRLIRPHPRGIILPPLGGPAEVRGREVKVRVFVSAAGTVDSVRLDPPTPSREYNERLAREALSWKWEPALRGGRKVAAWAEYTIAIPR